MQSAIDPGESLSIGSRALHELIRDRLRALIVRGTLAPGSNIAEAELSGRLGTSRTPLREALKLLGAEGLVELRSNRGAYVLPINPADARDAFAVAASLERLGAEQAAVRAQPAELETLRRMQARMEAEYAARDLDAYFETNQAIHRFIVGLSRNQALRTTHEMLFARVERLRFAALRHQPRWDESIDEHREVLAALEAGRAKAAGSAMARHVQRTGEAAHEALTALA